MNCRTYENSDYSTVVRWWECQRINVVPSSILPKCGIVVEHEGKPVGAIWAYMDNSIGVSFLAYPTVAPEALERMLGPSVVQHLIGCIEAVLKTHNYSVTVITSAIPTMVKLLKRAGYSECHASAWEGMKVLQ